MTTLSRSPQVAIADERLHRFIGFSLAFHLVLLIFLVVRGYFFPTEQIKPENVIKVDLVAMPDKIAKMPTLPEPPVPLEKPDATKSEPAPPEPAKPALAEKKPEPPSKPKLNLNKTKREEASALKRLEAIEKLKRLAAESKEHPAKPAAPSRGESPPLVKGNVVSHGSSLKGMAKLDYENYQDKVREHIRKFWNLPQWMASANLTARARVWADASGSILRKEMTRKSTQPAYDEQVMQALESSSPLPRPPNELVDIMAAEGIEIEFP